MINRIANPDELLLRATELKRKHFRPGFEVYRLGKAIAGNNGFL